MKKIVLYCIFMIACFGAPDPKMAQTNSNQTQDQKGWFFGVGFGAGIQAWKIRYIAQRMGSDHFFLSNTSAKIGAYHQFTETIGLRYYYSFDLSYMQGDIASNVFSNETTRGVPKTEFFIESQTHMLNADLIVKAYSKENKRLDLIVGFGAGSFMPKYHTRNGEQRSEADNYASSYSVNFQARINAGAKMLFNQKYGLELLAQIPIIPATLGSSKWSEGGSGIKSKADEIELANYTINLNFIIEL